MSAFEDFCKKMKDISNNEAQMAKLNEADKTALSVCIDQGEEFIKENPLASK